MSDGIGTTFDAVKAGLVQALADRDELRGVQVEDGWPNPDEIETEGIIVGDIEGGQEPGAMRSGGGTRRETYRIICHVWNRERTNDRREVRQRAVALAQVLEKTVFASNQPGPPFGVTGVQNLIVGEYNMTELPTDGGRECNFEVEVQVKTHLRP